MFRYAQTNVQLFTQLRSTGYPDEELNCIRKSYELAVHLFSGFFIQSGRTQIAHVVGTASILGSIHLPGEVLAAGLIHNAYGNGDFGDGKEGVSWPRRKYLINAVGENVEQYVYKFSELRWNNETIRAFPAKLETMESPERNVLLIRLADMLDHHSYLGGFYYHRSIEKCREFISQNGPIMMQMAEKLGFPDLSAEFERVVNETLSAEIPTALADEVSQSCARLIVPQSYRKRFSLAIAQKLAALLAAFRNI